MTEATDGKQLISTILAQGRGWLAAPAVGIPAYGSHVGGHRGHYRAPWHCSAVAALALLSMRSCSLAFKLFLLIHTQWKPDPRISSWMAMSTKSGKATRKVPERPPDDR